MPLSRSNILIVEDQAIIVLRTGNLRAKRSLAKFRHRTR